MANPAHLAILEQVVAVWNQWRKDNPESSPDLSGLDLGRADLRGAISTVDTTWLDGFDHNETGMNLSDDKGKPAEDSE